MRFQTTEEAAVWVSDAVRDCYRMPFRTFADQRNGETIAVAPEEGVREVYVPEEARVVDDLLNAMIASMVSRATTLSTPLRRGVPGKRDLARLRRTIESTGQYIDTDLPRPIARNLFPVRRSLVVSRAYRVMPEPIPHELEGSTGVNTIFDGDEPRQCSRVGAEYVCLGCGSSVYCDEECQTEDWEDGHDIACARHRDGDGE